MTQQQKIRVNMITKEQIKKAARLEFSDRDESLERIGFIKGANFAISHRSDLLDEVKKLRDEYVDIHKKSKFLFDFNRLSMTADDVTYCKNEIRMAKRIKDELTQIINKAEVLSNDNKEE